MNDTIQHGPTEPDAMLSRLAEIREVAQREIDHFGHRIKVVGEPGPDQARVPDRMQCDVCGTADDAHPRCSHQGAFEALFEILDLAAVPETELMMSIDEEGIEQAVAEEEEREAARSQMVVDIQERAMGKAGRKNR